MRRRIYQWLGLDILEAHLIDIRENCLSDHKLLNNIDARLNNMQLALTEPINKLATALLDEHSTARKAASDMLGTETLKRADAEDKARRHTLGELE